MKRVTDEELNSAIFKPNKSPKKLPAMTVVIYDKAGNEVDALPKDQIMASRHQEGKNFKYYVRTNRDKELYNPYDKLWIENSYRIARRDALEPFKMYQTNKDCFDSYLDFLKTGKDVYLRKAQGTL